MSMIGKIRESLLVNSNWRNFATSRRLEHSNRYGDYPKPPNSNYDCPGHKKSLSGFFLLPFARFGFLAALCIGGLLFWLLLPAVDSIAAPQRAPPGSYYNANSVRSSDSLRLLNIQPAPQDRRELKRPPIFFSCSHIGFVLPITAIAFSE